MVPDLPESRHSSTAERMTTPSLAQGVSVGTTATITTTKQAAPQTAATISPGKEMDPGDLLPWLPCTLALEVEVVGFTVETLLNLAQSSLVKTACHQSADIPLRVNGILMAWTEFEVVGDRLAARITDLV